MAQKLPEITQRDGRDLVCCQSTSESMAGYDAGNEYHEEVFHFLGRTITKTLPPLHIHRTHMHSCHQLIPPHKHKKGAQGAAGQLRWTITSHARKENLPHVHSAMLHAHKAISSQPYAPLTLTSLLRTPGPPLSHRATPRETLPKRYSQGGWRWPWVAKERGNRDSGGDVKREGHDRLTSARM